MPRYYFDVHDGVEVHDAEGRELPDAATARHEAVKHVSAFAADPDRLIREGVIIVTVRDADAVIATVRLACQIETA